MIVAVPTDTVVTKPVLLIVAMVGFKLAQVPPTVAFANCVVVPKHGTRLPVIVATVGDARTVMVVVIEPAAQPLGAIEL